VWPDDPSLYPGGQIQSCGPQEPLLPLDKLVDLQLTCGRHSRSSSFQPNASAQSVPCAQWCCRSPRHAHCARGPSGLRGARYRWCAIAPSDSPLVREPSLVLPGFTVRCPGASSSREVRGSIWESGSLVMYLARPAVAMGIDGLPRLAGGGRQFFTAPDSFRPSLGEVDQHRVAVRRACPTMQPTVSCLLS
jgi:hypothetical protein